MKYEYKRLTIDSYIENLYKDGLQESSILHPDNIRSKVEAIGIFRLKGYVKAFRSVLNSYSIDDLFELYDIDREISYNMFALSSQIEIKLKTYLVEIVYEYVDNPFFYLLKESYIENFQLSYDYLYDWKICDNNKRAEVYMHYRDYFLSHYNFINNRIYIDNQKTIDLYKDINYPPFHYFIESLTLGALIKLISKLKIKNKHILKLVSKKFGIYNKDLFLNYLLRLKELRNRCAHNARLFNRNYRSVKAISKYKIIRKNIYDHRLLDVYYSLNFLLDGSKTINSSDELEEKFILDIIKRRGKITDFIINFIKKR